MAGRIELVVSMEASFYLSVHRMLWKFKYLPKYGYFPLELTLDIDKKLSCRRGTARRAVSVKTVLNVAQMFVELLLISSALGE